MKLESCAVQGPAELEGIESSALTEIVNDFLAGLPKEKRIIFVQRYFYMDAVSDIAAANGMTVSAVKVSLLRMRRKLGKKLQEGKYI
ncbi:RNA polymerase sigma factor [Lactobacillus delbrueckii subsp. bulgaricus]